MATARLSKKIRNTLSCRGPAVGNEPLTAIRVTTGSGEAVT